MAKDRKPGKLAVLAMAGAMLLSACAAATDDSATSTDDDVPGENPDATATPSFPSPGGSDAAVPVVSDQYQNIDYDADSQASALQGNRSDTSFPEPLIEPDLIAAVVPPDAIPAIDRPDFVAIDEVADLDPSEALVVVEVNGEAKAYPVQILIWHEIVNDEIGGVPVSVTYCPLCNSALAFERQFGRRLLDFGTSGELYQSALVMYDRQTESLWAHFTGEGLVGHFAGAELRSVPAQMLSFEQVQVDYPDALVLTRNTGASRPYGTNPYIGYDEESSDPIDRFFNGDVDPRLSPKTRVVGVVLDNVATAVHLAGPDKLSIAQVGDDAESVVIFQAPGLASALDRAAISAGYDVGQTGVFRPVDEDGNRLTFSVQDGNVTDETGSTWALSGQAVDGPLEGQRLESVPHLNTFWFAWASYHPDTNIVES